jgi:hypothetical protein
MEWQGIAIIGVVGLVLFVRPQTFSKPNGDIGRDVRLRRGLQEAGKMFLHLAVLMVVLKLLAGS